MKKWEKNISEFMGMICDEEKTVYKPIMDFLIELEYTPIKKRTKGFILSFSNLSHNRVMARFGIREGSTDSFFGLRFSACTDYSDKFSNVIRERIESKNNRLAKCNSCKYCKGDKFVYTYKFQNGETKAACGAFMLDIPQVTLDNIAEIKKLIKEQHDYFMKHALYTLPQRT
ncbi:MAG: hypothetical protein FWB88_04875 [Defluviitaleaceae bacterium]|nr:hypothetical protein [Defluviitaleaceae bacterium]MCL2238637.1 hypothetical protein [Defluviitaleaceae bacterium]